MSSPESPEEVPVPNLRRNREKHKPTRNSGLQGPSRLDLGGEGATGHPHQGREGLGVARATERSISGDRILSPDLGTGQETLPWVLRPRDQRRKGLR